VDVPDRHVATLSRMRKSHFSTNGPRDLIRKRRSSCPKSSATLDATRLFEEDYLT
jgi:hypothetical protein